MEGMDAGAGAPDIPRLLFEPNARINGPIEQPTLPAFLESLGNVRRSGGALRLELNTQGGNADIARRIAGEIRYFLRGQGRTGHVIGKSCVYSAGVTILAAFPRQARFLTDDAVLLIHERHLTQSIDLKGQSNPACRSCANSCRCWRRRRISRWRASASSSGKATCPSGTCWKRSGGTATCAPMSRHGTAWSNG